MSTAGGSLAIESERGEGFRWCRRARADQDPDFLRFRYGGTNDAKPHLGPSPTFRDAFVDIQVHLLRRPPVFWARLWIGVEC
jgi:hypothetical protein